MGVNIGYARCSTTSQDLTAQREQLTALGVPADRVYLDKGLTGTSRARPGLDQALAAVRGGDTFTVTKLDRLDRLARSVPDALAILTQLSDRGVRFALGGSIYDWHDPMARMFLQILAVIAEFEAALIGQRTREGMTIARSRGRLRGKPPSLAPSPGPRDPPHARQRRLPHRRNRRDLQSLPAHHLPRPSAHHPRQREPAPRHPPRPAQRGPIRSAPARPPGHRPVAITSR